MVKNCDLGLRPRAVFSRPRSQFLTIRTSQPQTTYIYSNLLFVFRLALQARSNTPQLVKILSDTTYQNVQ